MIRKKYFTSFVVVCLAAASSSTALAADVKQVPQANPTKLSVDVIYWNPGAKGGDGIHTPHSATIHPENDLGLGRGNNLSLTLRYQPNFRQTWYVGGDGADLQGSRTFTKTFRFNNTNYNSGDRVSSELKATNTQIGLHNQWSEHSNFYTNYQFNHSRLKTSLDNKTLRHSDGRDDTYNSFSLGLGWETRSKSKLNFFAEINPFVLGRNIYCEQKIGIKAPVNKNMEFTLGYKNEQYRVGNTSSDSRTDVVLGGFFFNLGGRF